MIPGSCRQAPSTSALPSRRPEPFLLASMASWLTRSPRPCASGWHRVLREQTGQRAGSTAQAPITTVNRRRLLRGNTWHACHQPWPEPVAENVGHAYYLCQYGGVARVLTVAAGSP